MNEVQCVSDIASAMRDVALLAFIAFLIWFFLKD
jgi:hypothetical protein